MKPKIGQIAINKKNPNLWVKVTSSEGLFLDSFSGYVIKGVSEHGMGVYRGLLCADYTFQDEAVELIPTHILHSSAEYESAKRFLEPMRIDAMKPNAKEWIIRGYLEQKELVENYELAQGLVADLSRTNNLATLQNKGIHFID